MRLRRLTDEGLQGWRDLLDDVHAVDFDQRREALVTDPNATRELDSEIYFNEATLANRLAIATHLDTVIGSLGIQDPELDAGLWSWLTLAGFEQLCARGRDRRWKTGKWYRWIFQPKDYKTYYRHLLAGPFMIYRAHKDDAARAAVVLCGAVANPGEAVEQLASTQAFVTSNGVMQAATDLYYDSESGALRRGAGGKGGGSARRLAAVLNQLDLTWDLFTLTGNEILEMIPREFDRFRAG